VLSVAASVSSFDAGSVSGSFGAQSYFATKLEEDLVARGVHLPNVHRPKIESAEKAYSISG
jgi:hypothetical protein